MEGYLPLEHALGWWCVSVPFIGVGLRRMATRFKSQPETKLLLGTSGGFVFVLSALKLPSLTGSCSHPTGMGLGTLLIGPSIMSVLGFVVLLFQAMLLAHGGLTTLGANCFSMAIVGAYVAHGVYRLSSRLQLPHSWCVFAAAAIADQMTYLVTAIQLAWAFPDPSSGFWGAAVKFLGVFSLTQIPLAIVEGLVSVVVMNLLRTHLTEVLMTAQRNMGVKSS
jgi:cobalt/nickel transport system permease protein